VTESHGIYYFQCLINVLKCFTIELEKASLSDWKKHHLVTESHGKVLEMLPHLKSRESVKLALSIRLSIHHQNPNLSINESL